MTPASGQSWAEVFFMKNVFKVLGIIALAAAIGLSFAGCDTGGGGTTPAPGTGGTGGTAAPQKTVYTWVAGDDSYRLEITEASNSRAAYTPKSGDTYVLTITTTNTITIKIEIKKSSGTVIVSSSSGKESTFELTPTTPTGAGTPFTVTVEETATNGLITGIVGDITLEDGTTEEAAEVLFFAYDGRGNNKTPNLDDDGKLIVIKGQELFNLLAEYEHFPTPNDPNNRVKKYILTKVTSPSADDSQEIKELRLKYAGMILLINNPILLI
jgi:hypothetical protein